MSYKPDIPQAPIWFKLLVYPVLFLISLLPFRVLYWISDLLYFLLYYVIKYRTAVVRHNLERAFPNKSKPEVTTLEIEYYKHLADVFVETIKGLSISRSEILNRMKYPTEKNIFETLNNENQNAFVVLSHSGNWEWVALASQPYCPQQVYFTYKPLSNQGFNWLMHKMRTRFSGLALSMQETPRAITSLNGAKKNFVLALIGDQSPSNLNGCYWMNFLNQETAFLNGPAKLAHKFNIPIIYLRQKKVRRGYYEAYFERYNTEGQSSDEIMNYICDTMENEIQSQPFTWLWSHRRWKHLKP
jgi:KDO2-lipid IV(A) lauroyltransferase